ncbi:MAG: FkbM family methyltransferase [Rhodoblastus sp.]|nr:FkbM family methyltransferase [Rhodoblastus sp.]
MTRSEKIEALAADPAFATLGRSLTVYYGDLAHENRMAALYARFVRPGDLAFDIGSHVGDRIGAFRRLGARVVALEPQPLCFRALRALYGDDANVALVDAACGAREGAISLRVNSANPTVTTASQDFVAAADGARGWEGQTWDATHDVRMTTLDALFAAHGAPAFAKIDVEGFEADVLAGLSRPLPALSFEFTTIQRDVAYRCLERLSALGNYRFDLSLGESHALAGEWISHQDMAALIAGLPHDANSGDVYCVLET